MHILFLTTAHNSLSQRAWVELSGRGHRVDVHVTHGSADMVTAVARSRPELIVAPMLKSAIPETVWRRHVCLIVHPGIRGDRGPSSLDWAIRENAAHWGVTVLQADAEMDAGPIWSWREFPMRAASKSSLYRHEVTEAAVAALLEAVERFQSRRHVPEPLDYACPGVRGRLRPAMRQSDRAIDWTMPMDEIVRRVRSADSVPGVRDTLCGEPFYLYGAHPEDGLRGRPGSLLARRDGAVCRACGDGAVWITHLKRPGGIKLPATMALGETLTGVPERPSSWEAAEAGR
ncbi:MAG TPA: formyltransferase family protein, partial [Candidatus Competibacteraceae bacterium]|nr:formyltransferase family protein [Candidatus Competibacteraceae bacterium]